MSFLTRLSNQTQVVVYPSPCHPRPRMLLPRITDSHPRPQTGWPPLQPPLPFSKLTLPRDESSERERCQPMIANTSKYTLLFLSVCMDVISWQKYGGRWRAIPVRRVPPALLWAVMHRTGMFDSRMNRSFELIQLNRLARRLANHFELGPS